MVISKKVKAMDEFEKAARRDKLKAKLYATAVVAVMMVGGLGLGEYLHDHDADTTPQKQQDETAQPVISAPQPGN